MKMRITPIAIISMFVVMIMAQASISYSSQPVMAANTSGISWQQQDTIPKHKKDTSMKRKNKDWPKKDTTNKPRRDTFPAKSGQ